MTNEDKYVDCGGGFRNDEKKLYEFTYNKQTIKIPFAIYKQILSGFLINGVLNNFVKKSEIYETLDCLPDFE